MKTPEEYKKTIRNLDKDYYFALDGLIKNYPRFKVFPHNEKDTSEYSVEQEGLLMLQEQLFLLKNGIQRNIEDLEKDIASMDYKITIAERNNLRLKEELDRLKNKEGASEQLLKDTQYLHNEDLTSNIILFIIIIGLSIGFYNSNFRKNKSRVGV